MEIGRNTYSREKFGLSSVALLCIVSLTPFCAIAQEEEKPVEVKVTRFYNPNEPTGATTERLIELMRQDPQIRIKEWGGIQLPGGAGRAPIMMAIAGKTAPDIMESWFHIIGNDIRQGFLYPLNEWIGDDTNGDGQIDDSEAKWERWKQIPQLWRQVATYEGKIYGIPQAPKYYMGVIYRMDMVRAAGLDPNNPPKTWEELIYWCQKLTDPAKEIPGAILKRGQRGIALVPYGFTWLPWMYAAGGTPIVQVRKSPTTGKEYVVPPDTVKFVTPEGEDLSKIKPTWRANFASKAGIAAAGLFHRLRWMKWMINPETGEPVNLSEENVKNGNVKVGERTISFSPEDVITGVARGQTGQRGTNAGELIGRGEVAMITWFVQDLAGIGESLGIDADLLSWFPFPAGPPPDGTRAVQVQQHYAVMVEAVGDRPKYERDKVWEAITAVTDKEVRDGDIRNRVLSGMARFVNPEDLKRLGFDDYLKDVPESIRKNYRQIDSGQIDVSTEPYMGFWVTMDSAINQQVLSLIISDTGEDFDYKAALEKVEHDANSGLMFGYPKEVLNRYRTAARAIFIILIVVMVLFIFKTIRTFMSRRKAEASQVYRGWLPWALVGPALLLIGLWSYYPLLRGMVMAFQDYKIAGESSFVGLDNFISLALDRSFWESMGRTVYFVVLNMCLAFLAPIFLALLLSEVPRGKILFRTLFFLPQVTSGLVIALLWKLMYDPTPYGVLNRILSFLNYIPLVHIEPQTWLQDPKMAMICCVIPTVWASMGMGSLIYLAALKGVPDEIYEAAEVDGAGIFTKIRRITVPTLLPLIIINFVGAFIATFQNMGNIFLLTFGGPGESTMVVGLRIWIEAYNNLRFSMATSMAWVLGTLLIGFTYVQIQFLKRVEFKKAEWD
jgi:multiple sugar transport system permease protein